MTMKTNLKIALLLALASTLAETASARPIRLTCRDTGNLYERPYRVSVDAHSMTINVNKSSGVLAGGNTYRIVQIEPESDGFSVTARKDVLNSTIKVSVAVDEKWIAYTDILTDRPFTIDYCR